MNATSPGEVLRSWRVETHRTQTALANEVGVFQEDISMIEKGTRKPTRTMAKLLEKLSDGKVAYDIWFNADASESAA